MCIIQVGDLRSVCALEKKKSKLQACQETTDSCEYMFDLLDMASSKGPVHVTKLFTHITSFHISCIS